MNWNTVCFVLCTYHCDYQEAFLQHKSTGTQHRTYVFQMRSCLRSSLLNIRWKRTVTHQSRILFSTTSSKQNKSLHQLTLYDSLSNSYKQIPLNVVNNSELKESECPIKPKGIAWYTCGPTTYDSAHLGHARTYVALDIIQRCLLYLHKQHTIHCNEIFPPPIFIMNITDVDDKILTRSKERNIPPLELARHYEKEFWQDMDALNCMRPTIVTRVTDYIESAIIPYIQKIEENGMAYRLEDGLYFDVVKFEEKSKTEKRNRYGKLAPGRDVSVFSWDDNNPNSETNTKDRQNQKRDPRDFVLWKTKEAENEELAWDSKWGVGRPGWHIECSAMIDSTMGLDALKENYRIMIHAGGVDLKFPHHTNEIAQAEAYRSDNESDQSEEWIPHWVHTGHLHIDGLKMSKSLKNFITIRDILHEDENDKYPFSSPADDFRLWCLGLSGNYRGPATYSKSRLDEAKVTREKLLRFLVDGSQWISRRKSSSENSSKWGVEENELLEQANICMRKCVEAMTGNQESGFDMDGAKYFATMLELAEIGNKYIVDNATRNSPTFALEKSISTLRECLSIVGFSDITVRAGLVSDLHHDNIGIGNESVINELVQFRKEVRKMSLDTVRNKESSNKNLAKDLLKLCDDVRDVNLPNIGIEIFDSEESEHQWRIGFRKNTSDSKEDKHALQKSIHHSKQSGHVTPETFFQLERFSNQFTRFDSDGFPTHDNEGKELSKRKIKKLVKKRDAFFNKT